MADRTAADSAGMSDEAVAKATGRTWPEWYAALDAAGADGKTHQEIVAAVGEVAPGTSGWWEQMVAVAYERARGLRQVHEKADGFSASKSKTVAVPIGRVYRAWADAAERRRWLPEPLDITTANEDKSLRARWPDGSRLAVYFWAKGDEKSQVQLEHSRLPDADAVAKTKAFWTERLGALVEHVKGG